MAFWGQTKTSWKSTAIFRRHWGHPKQSDGSRIGNLRLKFVFINIHFYHYFWLLSRNKSKLSKFWFKIRVLLVWQNTYTKSRSNADIHICKCKQYSWTLHDSFFHRFFLEEGQSVIPSKEEFKAIGGDHLDIQAYLASGPSEPPQVSSLVSIGST